VIDFHNHFVGNLPSEAPRAWPMLADRGALERSLEQVEARVMSTPLEFAPGVPVQRINDAMAELVATDERLVGLATIDAYGAQDRELERAVAQLGLRGVFIESAKGQLLPDCAQAQAVFAVAAAMGVPVFLHPVPDAPLKARFGNERFVRGTINGAAIRAMIESGMFERYAGLKVVVTALALGGLLLAERIPDGVYVDTTAMNAAKLRAATELMGSNRLVAGTDWPVVQESVHLPEPIAGDNARTLLRL